MKKFGVSGLGGKSADAGGKPRPKKTAKPRKMKGFEMAVKKYQNGGLTGLDRAAAMSGRTMPTTGRPAVTGLDRAAAMSGRTMPTTGRPVGMKKGGVSSSLKAHAAAPASKAHAKGMAKGGAASRADGVAKKGKTSTKMVKMAKGGKCK